MQQVRKIGTRAILVAMACAAITACPDAPQEEASANTEKTAVSIARAAPAPTDSTRTAASESEKTIVRIKSELGEIRDQIAGLRGSAAKEQQGALADLESERARLWKEIELLGVSKERWNAALARVVESVERLQEKLSEFEEKKPG